MTSRGTRENVHLIPSKTTSRGARENVHLILPKTSKTPEGRRATAGWEDEGRWAKPNPHSAPASQRDRSVAAA